MIGLSNGSKQGGKSGRHSKLIRNVAGRISLPEVGGWGGGGGGGGGGGVLLYIS